MGKRIDRDSGFLVAMIVAEAAMASIVTNSHLSSIIVPGSMKSPAIKEVML
jgi:hypothetical protein